ncbi:MAG: hypothetical protein ACK5MW_05890 [Enterococcus sp.]
MNQFETEIKRLVNGEIEKIEVPKEQVLRFREVWVTSEYRQSLIGEAHLGGSVTYRYQVK